MQDLHSWQLKWRILSIFNQSWRCGAVTQKKTFFCRRMLSPKALWLAELREKLTHYTYVFSRAGLCLCSILTRSFYSYTWLEFWDYKFVQRISRFSDQFCLLKSYRFLYNTIVCNVLFNKSLDLTENMKILQQFVNFNFIKNNY